MKFFNERADFRVLKEHRELIEQALVDDGGEKYDSFSHYIRVAIIEKLRRDGYLPKEQTQYNVKFSKKADEVYKELEKEAFREISKRKEFDIPKKERRVLKDGTKL